MSAHIVAITATSGRPKAFATLNKWLDRQTLENWDWLVCCDDWEGYKFPKRKGVKVIKREQDTDLPSINANYLTLLDAAASYDKIVVLEDDDFICPTYLSEMNKMLDKADLVGFAEDAYYYVLSRRPLRFHNDGWAVLASTGFKKSVVPVLKDIVFKSNTHFDYPLWNTYTGKKLLIHNFWGLPMNSREEPKMKDGYVVNEHPRHVGMKENWHGGQDGISIRHTQAAGGFDITGDCLKKWIGEEDANFYLSFTRTPPIGTAGILMPMPSTELF